MSALHDDTEPSGGATRFLAEFLAARECGEAPDVEALCQRAGPHADELRKRIRALSVIDDLGAALRGEADDRGSGLYARSERVGRYEVRRLLGEGGLSRVYVAFDPDLEREVALKVISSAHVTADGARGWIRQEGRTIAQLEHPGVVRVFDLGEADGRAYVAMELVEGPNLADVIAELRARRTGGNARSADARVRAAADRLADLGARTALALHLARALAACHARGVLHRDVKPGNVLLGADGAPKLIDFGLAHIDEGNGSLNAVTQLLIGTPAYIAPEQVESGRIGADPRSDQFSFGALLYELLTLEASFRRDTRSGTLDAVALARPRPLRRVDSAIPSDLETICLHALELDPRDRYATMDELADDLQAFLEHRAIAISSPGLGRRLRLWARRNRREALLITVPAAAGLLALAGWRILDSRDAHARLSEEIRAAREAARTLEDPLQVLTALQRAKEYESRGRRLDLGFVSPLFFGRLEPAGEACLREVSDRLAACIAAGRAELGPVRDPNRAESENELMERWASALAVEEALCPECPANAADRARGRVELPEPPPGTRLRLSRLAPASLPMLCDPIPIEARRALGTGEFRVQWLDDSARTLGEFDLPIRPRNPGAVLVLRPIPPEVRARFVRVAAGTVRIGQDPRPVAVPEFWAYAGWLTGDDIWARAGEKALTGDDSLESAYSARGPAPMPGQAAFAARGCSARLPGIAEAVRILELTAAGGSPFEPLPAGAGGEFCSGPPAQSGRPHLSHRPDRTPAHSVAPVLDGGLPATANGTATFVFRLVVSQEPAP